MLHGVATLLGRSLRLEAKWLRTHLFRLVFTFFIYFMMLMAQVMSLTVGAPGLAFFGQMLFLNAVFITLGGVGFFATAITEEKEEDTIGLLMMAGINPLGLLLGKSTSRLFQALLLVLIQFPFTLLAITLGGVTLHQVLGAYASLLAYTVLLANVGLLASVVSKRSGTAMAWTTLFLIAYTVGPLLTAAARSWLAAEGLLVGALGGVVEPVLDWIGESGVWAKLIDIQTTGYADPIVGSQVITNVVGAGLCFLVAWAVFGWFALTDDNAAVSRGLLTRRRGRVRWLSASRAWSNPFVWKDYYFLAGGHTVLLLKFVGYGLLLGAFVAFDLTGASHLAAVVGLLILEASVYASRIFHDEIRGQTMVNLLTLPRSIGYVSYSKVLGTMFGLVPALLWIGIDACAFWPDGPADVIAMLGEPGFWSLALMVNVFLHLVVLLSLFVKWGALPLAFLATVMSLQCCPLLGFAVLFIGEADAMAKSLAVATLGIVHVVVGFVFQMMIHARLYELGSK